MVIPETTHEALSDPRRGPADLAERSSRGLQVPPEPPRHCRPRGSQGLAASHRRVTGLKGLCKGGKSQGSSGIAWYVEDNDNPQCTGAGLFIGCTADSNGTRVRHRGRFRDRATIKVENSADAPGVTVGLSGTLTGNGVVSIRRHSVVPDSASPWDAGASRDTQNRRQSRPEPQLNNTANTVCHVTPTTADSVSVSQTTGGVATLGGRLTVIMTGHLYARYVVHSPARGRRPWSDHVRERLNHAPWPAAHVSARSSIMMMTE